MCRYWPCTLRRASSFYDNKFKAVFGAQGKDAAAVGRLRPTAAGCVQVDAYCELVADVDLEVDARYELVVDVDLEVDARYELVAAADLEADARLQTEQGGASHFQPAPASSSRLRPAVAGCGRRCSGRPCIRRARVELINSGGTWHMNAVVQAHLHVPLMAMYFTSGEFFYDINLKAVFGALGKVAAAALAGCGRRLPSSSKKTRVASWWRTST
jgi:hypothetical protein